MIAYLQLLWLMKSPPALFSRLYGMPWYRDMLEQWVAPMLTADAKVLEVGCAGGDFSRSLAQRNFKVSAVDRSAQMLAQARRIPSTVQFKQADAAQLPFPDQCFDVVLAASLLNVVDSPRAVIDQMRRVCREGGVVSVLVPNLLFSDAHAKQYLETEPLSGLSRAAFATWYHLGRKMDTDVLRGYFEDCGLVNITQQGLLGGMVVVTSGYRPASVSR